MKTQPERDELWGDLLSEAGSAGFREAALDRTLAAVRRHQRWQRRLRLAATATVPCVLLGLIFWQGRDAALRRSVSRDSAMPVTARPPDVVPGTHIRLISDEELFAMFPDRPAALIGPDEDRRFVLLDEAAKPASHFHPSAKAQRL
jgi:hypothetical protein